jgi:S-adenosyl-L-methionine hydrolase (adenosine-forming)
MITLTTDFGGADWFAGAMKGVILRIHPGACVVDITHEIPPGNLKAGAFLLMAGCRFFPKGAVHLAVVDPGVGSDRKAIAVQTANGFFVGPDNGILSWALARDRILAIRQLENPKYFLQPVSRTFHGRDIFAPVAARLDRGLPLARLGRELTEIVRFPWPKAIRQGDEFRGEIVYIDRFGNAITNIEAEMLPTQGASACKVKVGRKLQCRLREFYRAAPENKPVALIGSTELLEIAVNGGSAAERFKLKIGEKVVVRQ